MRGIHSVLLCPGTKLAGYPLAQLEGMIVGDNDLCPIKIIQHVDGYNCKIRSKLDTDSDLNWTPIPEKVGQSFRF